MKGIAPPGLVDGLIETKETSNVLHTKKKSVKKGIDLISTGSGLASLVNKGFVTPGNQGSVTQEDLSLANSVDHSNSKPVKGLANPEIQGLETSFDVVVASLTDQCQKNEANSKKLTKQRFENPVVPSLASPVDQDKS